MKALRADSSAFQDDVPNFVPSGSKVSSLNVPQSRTRVAHPKSQWVEELKKRFDELTALPRGWDGYGGRPVSFNCAFFAANMIERLFTDGVPAPQLVPGGDGTIQFEWHRNQYDVEIDVLAPYDVVAVRRDHRTGAVDEIELQADFSVLSDWIGHLKTNQPALAQAGE